MLEFKDQMLYKGKWVNCHSPNNIYSKTYKTKEEALRHIDIVDANWEKYKEYHPLNKNVPEDYRVVSREVTEWKEA